MNTKPVEIIPTYACMVDAFIAVLQNENANYESLNTARGFFIDCAQIADQHAAERVAWIADYEAAQTLLAEREP